MRAEWTGAKRFVVKIGSSLLVDSKSGTLKAQWLASLCDDIAKLKAQGKDVIVVSSGAIALGRFMAGEGQRMYGRTTTSGTPDRYASIVRQPIGVAGLIIAANTPIANAAWKVFPALVCGNAAVLKAAEDTPLTAWLFAALAHDPAGWGEWFPGFSRDGRYVTPAPHGVGSQREVRVGRTRLVETVLAWEEGRRWAFTIAEGGMPGVKALAEDYVVEPEGSGSRLTWTLATETSPHLAGKVTGALTGVLGKRAFGKLDRVLAAGVRR